MLMDKTLIVGIGNLLCRDEGIGVHVIQEMEKMELPGHIELLDIGTSTMDLISYLDGVKKLIVIDAMKSRGILLARFTNANPRIYCPKMRDPFRSMRLVS